MLTKHAVIVDDNNSNLGVLAELLMVEGLGYTKVQDATYLAQVLQTVPHVDVIFLDLEMPHVNGYEVLADLKADARFKNTPVVAYTVHLNEINNARSHGFHSFIGKPINVDRFPQQLARILHGEQVWMTV
jgi:CheY-like chemotaxis protein